MAKSLTSVIGVDLGRYALKSVLLHKKSGNRMVITHYACQQIDDSVERSPDELSRQLKALFKQLGGNAKACAVAVSSPEALIRIIDQPDTPTHILRDALRLNGQSFFNQDCRDFVLDCDYVPTAQPLPTEFGVPQQKRYLVAGLPRAQVDVVGKLFAENGIGTLASIQLAPVGVFNAFEFAHPEIFNQQAFFLLDIGHTSSTMIIGSKREMVLIRNIEFGGRTLRDTLANLSSEEPRSVMRTLEQEDELMIENARIALMALTREIGSSIGFFEGRREETVGQVWVSGGVAKNKVVLRVLSEELHLPCQSWNAAERCEIAVSASKRARFTEEILDYSVACGAATQLLTA